MKASTLLLSALIALASTSAASAEKRPGHFKGLPAKTLTQAVANFSESNAKLDALIKQKTLTPQDLQQVHELTYTLENALRKINAELTALAGTLEAVHVASERADPATVKTQGKAYLESARQVVK